MNKILLIDNYDSFTFNIKQLLLKCVYNLKTPFQVLVEKNDNPELPKISLNSSDLLIIGPGPGSPIDTGYSSLILEKFSNLKTLGVCLGHQLLGELHGAKVNKAKNPMHGRCSRIFHDNSSLYQKINNGILVARYHSLSINKNNLPKEIIATALSDDDEIMSIEIKNSFRYGVQFHPESFMTKDGENIITNFILKSS